MRGQLLIALLTLSVAACNSLPGTPAAAYLPPGVFGTYQDNDVGAINQSAWAFASPANTRANQSQQSKRLSPWSTCLAN